MKARLTFAKSYQEKRFIDSGEWPESQAALDIPTADLSPDERRTLLELRNQGAALFDRLPGLPGGSIIYPGKSYDTDQKPETVEDWRRLLLEFARAAREHRTALEAKREKDFREYLEKCRAALEENDQALQAKGGHLFKVPEWFADHPEIDQAREVAGQIETRLDALRAERDRREREERAARKAQNEAEEARLEAERKAWVEDHGSERLKKACAAGYMCERLYIEERAALEYPGFTVDFGSDAEWKGRSCPSLEALELAEAVKGKVVWLKRPPYPLERDAYGDEDRYDTREAVHVAALGHDLFRGVEVEP